MQRTTPEGQRQEKGVQQRSVRTRTTREEPKACAEETGHGKEAEGKGEAPRHPEAGKEIREEGGTAGGVADRRAEGAEKEEILEEPEPPPEQKPSQTTTHL